MGSLTPTAASQRSQALKQANRVRSGRATLKRALGDGRRTAGEVISDPPAIARAMQVKQVLLSQRGWGPARCGRLLRSASVPERKELGSLTERQRRALLMTLDVFDNANRVRIHEFRSF